MKSMVSLLGGLVCCLSSYVVRGPFLSCVCQMRVGMIFFLKSACGEIKRTCVGIYAKGKKVYLTPNYWGWSSLPSQL
jgi:hypothetical protein